MELFSKFIIETDDELGDCLILSKVTYHKEMVTDKTKVKGGGMFYFDSDNNTFVFSGESYDFGCAKIEDIKNCVENKNVYTNNALCFSIADKHKFCYIDQCGEKTIFN